MFTVKKNKDFQTFHTFHIHYIKVFVKKTPSNKIFYFSKEDIDSVWIGLNDKVKENTYVWSNPSVMSIWRNWRSGQPNNAISADGKTQDCVVILRNGKWNDKRCSRYEFSVCEVRGKARAQNFGHKTGCVLLW